MKVSLAESVVIFKCLDFQAGALAVIMGYKLFLLAALLASCGATKYGDPESYEDQKEEYQYPPLPYNFGYSNDDGYGSTQYRSETGDGKGKVEGRYGYKDANGVERIVEYVADEYGYRAQIKTNEPGTENKSPAAVELYANPIEIPYEPQVYAQGYAAEQYGAQQYASAPTKKQETQKFSATRFQSLSDQKSEEYATTSEPEKYTTPKQLTQQFSAAAKKQPAPFFAIQRPPQFVAVRQPQAVLFAPQPRPVLAAPLPGPVLAAPLPQPVLAAAPLPRRVFAAPHPHPVLAAVPHPQPVLAVPQPAFAAVPHHQPVLAAVPHPQPVLAAVPHPQPAFAAVPHPHPVLAAVPHPQPVLAAVPHPQPVLAAVPHPQPVFAAPHPQPILATHGQPIQHFAFHQRHFQAAPSVLQQVHHTSSNTKTQPQHFQVQATHQFFNLGSQQQH